MRRRLLALILCLAPTLGWAAEPKADISGPTAAVVGEKVLLDVSGSVTDADMPLQVQAIGPDTPSLRVWYDDKAHPGLVVMSAAKPGTYILIVIAAGTVEGRAVPAFRFASWAVQISLVAPTPKPPGPDPKPPPGPDPTPGPGPITGNLYGMLVLPDFPTAAQAALRTNAFIRSEFATQKAFFSSYLESESEVRDFPTWRAAVTAAGGTPCILWFDSKGSLVGSSKQVAAASVVDQLKALRGVK